MPSHQPLTGILLAAGVGLRFDPSGRQNKLLQTLSDGEILVVRSAKNLLSVIPEVVAVVRPGAQQLAEHLDVAGCRVIVCADAQTGMAASLVSALQHSSDSAAWLIALADMPYLQTSTLTALSQTLQSGADIVVPVYQERRGNPVGFSRLYLPQLLALEGDQGARGILRTNKVTEVLVDDAGIHRDVDTPSDL